MGRRGWSWRGREANRATCGGQVAEHLAGGRASTVGDASRQSSAVHARRCGTSTLLVHPFLVAQALVLAPPARKRHRFPHRNVYEATRPSCVPQTRPPTTQTPLQPLCEPEDSGSSQLRARLQAPLHVWLGTSSLNARIFCVPVHCIPHRHSLPKFLYRQKVAHPS